jgi:serine/threonine protein kinase
MLFLTRVVGWRLLLSLPPSPQGTPTHMSPELFMAGHVSKASDVYAFGILLWETMTGQRAFAGVPIPLLPHEVAREGLRPTWPTTLARQSPVYPQLQRLAEACWAGNPVDRWVAVGHASRACARLQWGLAALPVQGHVMTRVGCIMHSVLSSCTLQLLTTI